jgi:hypothetical protein
MLQRGKFEHEKEIQGKMNLQRGNFHFHGRVLWWRDEKVGSYEFDDGGVSLGLLADGMFEGVFEYIWWLIETKYTEQRAGKSENSGKASMNGEDWTKDCLRFKILWISNCILHLHLTLPQKLHSSLPQNQTHSRPLTYFIYESPSALKDLHHHFSKFSSTTLQQKGLKLMCVSLWHLKQDWKAI